MRRARIAVAALVSASGVLAAYGATPLPTGELEERRDAYMPAADDSRAEEGKRRLKKSAEEVAAEMREMHDFWCHPGMGRSETSLCKDIRRREAAGEPAAAVEDAEARAARSKEDKAAVAVMHALYCGVNDHETTKHPCLMWSARETRKRRRKLMANGMKPDFVGLDLSSGSFRAEAEAFLADALDGEEL